MNVNALQIRRLLGRSNWSTPVPFGPDGWKLERLDRTGSVIVTVADHDGEDWIHASIARPREMPTYADLKVLHAAVFGSDWAYQVFAPGRGGAASMTVAKDRPGGVREHCPMVGKSQPAGRFVMEPREDGSVSWHVTAPRELPADAPDDDVAKLDSLAPPPRSQRDIQERLQWGSNRAMNALRRWRDLQKPGNDGAPA